MTNNPDKRIQDLVMAVFPGAEVVEKKPGNSVIQPTPPPRPRTRVVGSRVLIPSDSMFADSGGDWSTFK